MDYDYETYLHEGVCEGLVVLGQDLRPLRVRSAVERLQVAHRQIVHRRAVVAAEPVKVRDAHRELREELVRLVEHPPRDLLRARVQQQRRLLVRLAARLVLHELDRVEDQVQLLDQQQHVRVDLEQLHAPRVPEPAQLQLRISLRLERLPEPLLHPGDDVRGRGEVREVVAEEETFELLRARLVCRVGEEHEVRDDVRDGLEVTIVSRDGKARYM